MFAAMENLNWFLVKSFSIFDSKYVLRWLHAVWILVF